MTVPTYGYNMEGVMDFVNSITASQDPKDSYGYKKIAMEAVVEDNRTKMIEILYQDIINKSNCDFGKIPDSKGVITQMVYYKQMSRSIEVLNKLLAEKPPEELKLMNKLHEMIIAERGNFVMGYTFDIEIIKTMYCTMVLALIDMINLCILAYADYLKDVKKIEFNYRAATNYDKFVVNNVKSILKSYQRGEWSKMMNSFRKEVMNIHQIALTSATVVGILAVVVGSAAIYFSMIVILNAIRQLIYVYYNASIKVADKIDEMNDFLKANIEIENNPKAMDRQQKMYTRLSSIRDFIHIHILKDEKKAQEELKKSDKEEFNKEKIKPPVTGNVDDIEFE